MTLPFPVLAEMRLAVTVRPQGLSRRGLAQVGKCPWGSRRGLARQVKAAGSPGP